MKRLAILLAGTYLLAAFVAAFGGPPANALEVCTRFGPGPADITCSNQNFPKLMLEQRTIDTRSHMDRFTYELVPKVEEQDDWPFPGKRIQAWNRGLTPSRQDLTRLRELKPQ